MDKLNDTVQIYESNYGTNLSDEQLARLEEHLESTPDLVIASFRHAYSGGFTGKGRHACLRNGYWCWSNLLKYPQDIIAYVKRRWHTLWVVN